MKRSTFFISTTFIILVLLLYPALAAAEKNDFGLISVNSSSVKVEFLTPIISETKILTVDNNTVEVKAKSLKELQNCIILSNSKITVDVDSCPELEKQAKISFKGIEYKNPRVFRNGLWVKDIKPIQVSKNEYYITVDGFSTWELKDSTFNGTFNNMTLYSGALGLLADTVFSMNDDWNNTNVTSTDTTQDYTSYSSNGSLTYIEYHTDSRDPAHSAWYQDYLRMGSEYNWVEIPNGTILINPNNTWSFGGEFNFKSNNNQLMGKPNSASSGSNLVLSIGSNNKFSCNCLNSTGSSIGISGTTNASIDGVTYYNISCVYNGTNILQYVNGNIDGTSTEVTCNSSYNSSFGIGSSFGTSTTVHHGNIRNTFYYRRTLNSTEVTNPYSANSTDLIFKIPLNDTN
ncbi:MAG: LamG-like jellyroll fold domain-containing protein, partial [Candidatus Woesearchaeota archaeon]